MPYTSKWFIYASKVTLARMSKKSSLEIARHGAIILQNTFVDVMFPKFFATKIGTAFCHYGT